MFACGPFPAFSPVLRETAVQGLLQPKSHLRLGSPSSLPAREGQQADLPKGDFRKVFFWTPKSQLPSNGLAWWRFAGCELSGLWGFRFTHCDFLSKQHPPPKKKNVPQGPPQKKERAKNTGRSGPPSPSSALHPAARWAPWRSALSSSEAPSKGSQSSSLRASDVAKWGGGGAGDAPSPEPSKHEPGDLACVFNPCTSQIATW